MQRRFRLRRSTEIAEARRAGKSYAHPLAVLIAAPVSGPARAAVVAGRSVGNAVERNRARRRLRAAVRPLIEKAPPGWDVVIIARKPALTANNEILVDALRSLFRRAGISPNENGVPGNGTAAGS